jgi:hypothetical protein
MILLCDIVTRCAFLSGNVWPRITIFLLCVMPDLMTLQKKVCVIEEEVGKKWS